MSHLAATPMRFASNFGVLDSEGETGSGVPSCTSQCGCTFFK
jgi:hypothetical protein